jgi:hypothetical protein
MKIFVVCLSLLVGMQACTSESSGPALAQNVPECAAGPLLGYVPDVQQTAEHRQFQLPVVTRPAGTKRYDWGFDLKVKVDPAGKPICYSKKGEFNKEQALDEQRMAVLSEMRNWQYVPFNVDGKPVEAIVAEHIHEQLAPEKHVPLPEVPLEQVHIMLGRSGCYGPCPIYKVGVYGDGRVVYTGRQYVDVEGEHSYRIPAEVVQKLVDSMKDKNIWSMQSSYRAAITDNPTYELFIQMGAEKHYIEDYVGKMAGMPAVVSEFENEVDEASQAKEWVTLAMPAVDHLVAEGFRFNSDVGAELLLRAVANRDGVDDAAILKLIELGTPLTIKVAPSSPYLPFFGSVIEAASQNGRSSLIAPLIAKGALQTNGHLDKEKLNSAFRAAIRGGNLESVKAIWDAADGKIRPALTFDDKSDESKRQKSPVILLLDNYGSDKRNWEGLEIAKWLVEQGCDLKAKAADGDTLLHIAAQANDIDFVRYLLAHGLSASESSKGYPALGSTTDEDVAMLLLEAGTDPSILNSNGYDFRGYAEDNHWKRVVEWLDKHQPKQSP